MTPDRRLGTLDITMAWALSAVLALLTLSWISAASLGGFDLKLPYAMSLVLGVSLLLSFGRAGVAFRDLIADVAPWMFAYVGYLFVLSFRLAGLPNNGIMIRQSFFLLCGVVVACSIVLLRANPRPFRQGGAIAIVGFVLVTEYYAWQIGLSWTVALERFFTNGDLGFVVYNFLREIFRTAQPGDIEVVASVKNTVAVGLFIALVFYRAGHRQQTVDRIGRLLTFIALIVLFLLNTRSVLLMALIALPMTSLIASIRNPRHSVYRMAMAFILLLAVVAVVVSIWSSDLAAISIVENRFSFDDHSSSGRMLQYQQALQGIEENILFGSGLIRFNDQLVHNLFLGAWLHGGLAAFLLVVAFYVSIFAGWVSFLFQITRHRNAWVLPMRVEWIAVLPLLPLFRIWVSGDAGHPEFSSWIGLFAFSAVVYVNKKERRATSSSPFQTNAVAA